jgi:hypothetical protein
MVTDYQMDGKLTMDFPQPMAETLMEIQMVMV